MSIFNYGDSVVLMEDLDELNKGSLGFILDDRGSVVYVNFGNKGNHFINQNFLRIAHNPNQQEIDFENKNINI